MGYDTRIPLDSELRDKLRGMKEGDETYTELIERILSEKRELEEQLDVLQFQVGEIDDE